MCAADRSKLVKTVRTDKSKSTNEDYDKLMVLLNEKVKAYNDLQLTSDALVKKLRAELTALDAKLREVNTNANEQQSKKRRFGVLDDEIVIPELKNIAQAPKVIKPKPTFAEAVKQSSDTPVERMRIIRFNVDTPQVEDTVLKDDIFKDKAIKSMNSRGNKAVFVKFDADTPIDDFELKGIEIQKVKEHVPSMKIVGIPPFASPVANVVTDILAQNALNANDFTYVRHFDVDLTRRRYTNIIVNCSVEVLKQCLLNGIFYGRHKLRCYEHVRAIQCLNRYAFGHVAANCLNKLTCKRCAGEHKEVDCTAKITDVKCANCLASKRAHDHRITSENCPSRRVWIGKRITFLEKRILPAKKINV